jgi:hypothetical protein
MHSGLRFGLFADACFGIPTVVEKDKHGFDAVLGGNA